MLEDAGPRPSSAGQADLVDDHERRFARACAARPGTRRYGRITRLRSRAGQHSAKLRRKKPLTLEGAGPWPISPGQADFSGTRRSAEGMRITATARALNSGVTAERITRQLIVATNLALPYEPEPVLLTERSLPR